MITIIIFTDNVFVVFPFTNIVKIYEIDNNEILSAADLSGMS